ncbi:MAG: DUF4093 domain-containing protein [Ruminococcus flavefaciens]|nr:DUF4093 domain-containing protein [Ruminococcus flavefaciens]MCM1229705.1 DUF4093 domain-containing protein [Ruminococcus flavefaciens]
MVKINEAIIVEGKYDKIKLSSIIDAVIIVTNGFGIFKDSEKLELIRYYARKTGIIILTDSDSAGRKIRGYIKGAVDGNIKNVHIPDIFGKEKRKRTASAEGKLGVEGIDVDVLLSAFEKAGITSGERTAPPDITKLTLYELGLSGGNNSSILRKKLQKSLELPSLLSAGALLEILNTMMTAEELAVKVRELEETDYGI